MLTIRQSLINDYERCPHLCFKLWGKFGDPDPPLRDSDEVTNKYAMCGTAIHSVFDKWAKITKGGAVFTKEQGHEYLDQLVDELPLDKFENAEDKEERRSMLHEQIDWTWHIYCTHPPLYSELHFSLDNVIEEFPPIEGTMDRIDGSFVTKDITLSDYKSGKKLTKIDVNSSPQVLLYCLAFKKMFGFLPKKFVFIFTKLEREMVVYITEDFIDRAMERLKSSWYRILQGDFKPPTKAPKFFCENFCPVRKGCPKWDRPKGWEGVR